MVLARACTVNNSIICSESSAYAFSSLLRLTTMFCSTSGCRYGDRYNRCTMESCADERNREGCCQTCYSGTLIPTTPVPTTRPAPRVAEDSSRVMFAVDSTQSPHNSGISTMVSGFHVCFVVTCTALVWLWMEH